MAPQIQPIYKLLQMPLTRNLGSISTLHSDTWLELAGKALGINNTTRWNSWFKLLKVTIKKQSELMMFMQQHHKALGDDILTHANWEVLKITAEFLKQFWQATQV